MKPRPLLLFGSGLTMCLVPFGVRAGTIKGTTTGSTVTAPALNVDPAVRDDSNTATAIDVTYFSYCPYIVNGASAFPTYNFVFAGVGDVGSHFTPVDPGDFTIDQYKPWVVNNNATNNNSPLNHGDPTTVNFVQAFVQNTNNGGFS